MGCQTLSLLFWEFPSLYDLAWNCLYFTVKGLIEFRYSLDQQLSWKLTFMPSFTYKDSQNITLKQVSKIFSNRFKLRPFFMDTLSLWHDKIIFSNMHHKLCWRLVSSNLAFIFLIDFLFKVWYYSPRLQNFTATWQQSLFSVSVNIDWAFISPVYRLLLLWMKYK